jgi:hypothetical protein
MIITDWFPGSVKPVRKGVYQREYTYGKTPNVQYCYWDGEHWFMGKHSADGALGVIDLGLAPNQSLPWRGVLK